MKALTKEEHLAAADEAWKLAESLGVTIGTDLTPLVELIAERNRLRSTSPQPKDPNG